MTRKAACAAFFMLPLDPGWSRATLPEGSAPADSPAVLVAPGREGPDPPSLIEDALGKVPPDDPKMESYSHGNDLLSLIGFLWTAGLLAILVASGLAARLQDLAETVSRKANFKVAVYAVLFTVVMFAGRLPFTLYAGYLREKRYGFAKETFAAWLCDWGKGLLIGALLLAIASVILYAAIRRTGRRWWLAGSCLSVLLAILILAIFPVFIAPLFNTFQPLKDPGLRSDILRMARRQGIPAEEVYEVDASRRTSHNNAYVAGLLGTERIVLYDTLQRQFTSREIQFIMGHEMGHFVLHHVWKTVAFLSIVALAGAFLVDRLARLVIERRPDLRIASISEPSSLPLIGLCLTVYLVPIGPAIATFSRMQERRADQFGLEVTRDPVAAASTFRKFGRFDLDEYHVHPLIEALLYDHPSLARRIHTAQEFARLHKASGPGE
jgi:STE24 endopeptidase